ncbi:uncharacterized protein E0L32_011543 [Thyridium curvatum]|uniref:diphosphomevalonate decarboxylase n=1 Tax=Thyridium curvatum TaxID=1093900 RepID=A0A507BJ28_9PEZI|nr:uncharacterized protein E0L32_011543 [Thyridium curvatum]TPX18794.1 hypothetical protein E0L32_011543 [Thyridium curvatum]
MADTKVYRASTTAPVNIAVVKYWGKRDTKLNLPTNSSLSVTLAQSDLRTLTTASCSSSYPSEQGDTLLLNGEPSDVSGARIQACFRALRARRAALEATDSSLPKLSAMPLRLVSENNFPTAAGLASSAAGFAALVRAIANLYELTDNPSQLSLIARQGSGSACRSLFGGYVAWRMGQAADGSDSLAEQVAPASHWPEMRALILVVSAAKKDVGSTSGMQQTVATSSLFQQRVREVVPANMAKMEKAIQDKDFGAFAEVTMRDSNSFHSTCSDSYPPIYYMNDVSRAAVRAVEAVNEAAGKTVAAYTFDAGPNAVIYYLEKDAEAVVGTFAAVVGGASGWKEGATSLKSGIALNETVASILKEGVSRVIMTGVGEGPEKTDIFLVEENGEPAKRYSNTFQANVTRSSNMSTICDIDQAGNVVCTYTESEKEGINVDKTKVPLGKAIFYAFLPAGFPHSVTDDYLSYQLFDSLQAFSSSIASLLANRAVLEGLGVGNADQSPTAALVLQIIQDTFSRLATILFAHRMGQAIEPEAKSYRFMADIFNDCSLFLDLLLPILPLFPKITVMVTASILRSLCGVSANASKASLSAHFAKVGNLAELNAKEASQETVVSLAGMLTGTLVVHMVKDKKAVWCWMVTLLGIHLYMNYRAVSAVKMLTLNRQRATIVFREYLEHGKIVTPEQASRRESILLKGRGRLWSKSGDYEGTCEFGTYGDVMNWNPWGYHRYVFETETYYMGIWHWRASFYIRIAMKEGSDDVHGPLLAWFDAVTHAYHFDQALKDGLDSHYESEGHHGYITQETKDTVLGALRSAGWDVDNNQLETMSPVRVRVGESKKGM